MRLSHTKTVFVRRTISTLFVLCAIAILVSDPLGLFRGSARPTARPATAAVNNSGSDQRYKIAQGYGRLPMSFEQNQGQMNRRVHFKARGLNYALSLSANEAVFAMRLDRAGESDKGIETLRMKLVGANPNAKGIGLDELPGKLNYFIGNDSRTWRKNIPTYEQVRYFGVYPGIDLVYYGNQQQLEYDFVIAPGASPRRIRLSFKGMKQIAIDRDGDLVLSSAAGDVRQQKPIAYQEFDGVRREVAVHYKLDGNKVGFETGAYDRRHPLVIDPVLVYSSFVGGSRVDQAFAIAVDTQGSAYLTGSTTSTDFSTPGAFQTVRDGGTDAFVVKVNPAGSAIVYATYLGGNANDVGTSIAVDAQGSAYVVGQTFSETFPHTAGVFQDAKDNFSEGFVAKLSPNGASLAYSTFLGGDISDFAFGVAVDAAGRAYVAGRTDSTRFRTFPFPTPRNGSPAYKSTDGAAHWFPSSSGLKVSTVNAFALDRFNSNIIYAAGFPGVFKSIDAGANWIPTGTANPSTAPITSNDVVVDPSNTSIIYVGSFEGIFKSTDGGTLYAQKLSSFNVVNALAIDPVTPTTIYAGTSENPIKSLDGGDSWETVDNGIGGAAGSVNEIVIDPSNPAIVYLATNGGVYKTTNGGSSWSAINTGDLASASLRQMNAIVMDPLDPSTLYVGGTASGSESIYKTTNGGGTWTTSATGLTYLIGGQTVRAWVNAIAVDPVTPTTIYAATAGGGLFKSTDAGANWSPSNTNFPKVSATEVVVDRNNPATVYAGTGIGSDAFVARFNVSGSALEYLANFGGDESDEARGVAIDTDNNAYVVGTTSSQNFPTAGAFQFVRGGGSDAFVAKINAAGSSFVYSTFLGGLNSEQGLAIAVRAGSAYVAGQTSSPNFPVVNPIRPAPANLDADAFVTKVHPSGASLDFSTCLGGESFDQALGLAVDVAGGVYVTGTTNSTTFPTVAAPQPSLVGAPFNDAFVTKLNAAGTAIAYSTYLGGAHVIDQGHGIAVDASGSAYITGWGGGNFPLASPFRPTATSTEGFITKLGSAVSSTTVHFSQVQYSVNEATPLVQIDVRRSGDLSGTSTVDFETISGTASDRSDFTPTFGTLTFAPGDAVESFSVLLTDDALIEGTESLRLKLSNPIGAILVSSESDPLPNDVLLEILDNDSNPSAPNPIENSVFFVRQHYHDFLNREPDAGGLAFWVDQIESCGSDVGCREVRRINVSAAFFLAIEFQETGYFAYRAYKAAYGDTTSPNVSGTVPIIRFQEFLPDTQQLGFGVQVGIGDWQQKLEANKNAYVLQFVQTPRFITAFPLSMTADQFVTKLDQNAGGVLSADEKAQLVALLTPAPADATKRASVLRSVAEDSDLRQRELNRAFVLMQFYGYLRRNPDDPQDTDFRGWKFWLDKLNQFNGNFVEAEMVKSFLVSGEYRQRFGTP